MVNVELLGEQTVHLMCKEKCRAAEKATRVPHNAFHVGSADGADDAQCQYHAVEGTANHAVNELQIKLPLEQQQQSYRRLEVFQIKL